MSATCAVAATFTVAWTCAASMFRTLCALCTLYTIALGGCATHRTVTWEEVDLPNASAATSTDKHRAGPAAALPSRERHSDPDPRRIGRAPTATSAPPAAGPRIDGALQDFVNARVLSKSQGKTSPVWGEGWEQVLRALSAAAALPPRASDLGAFVRARVTLEVELARDRERGVLLPSDLGRRVQEVLLAVDESVGELRAANVPGTLRPPPRLGDGELVLRAPLSPFILSSPFGVRSDPFTGAQRFHAGIDLDAPHGSVVYTSASGLVVYAGMQGGYGKQVVIDHGDGVRTHYSHLSAILVDPGQTVEEGDAVAHVGSTGRSTGPHLHFAVTNAEGEFLDPAALLDVPWSSIAEQVNIGPSKNKVSYPLANQGDTVEITAESSAARN